MKHLILLALLAAGSICAELPNAKLTPGDTLPVTAKQVCVPGYSTRIRNVTARTKRLVFRRYGIAYVPPKYEVDHLISLELGGSNSIKNLWPQAYCPDGYCAKQKDALEDRLHALVCSGDMTLVDAQKAISTDWVTEYKRLLKQ